MNATRPGLKVWIRLSRGMGMESWAVLGALFGAGSDRGDKDGLDR
jgi:hypothetical protein